MAAVYCLLLFYYAPCSCPCASGAWTATWEVPSKLVHQRQNCMRATHNDTLPAYTCYTGSLTDLVTCCPIQLVNHAMKVA